MLIFRPIGFAYRELIINRRKQIPFWVLAGFLPTYVTARLIVQHYPYLFIHVRGVHVHHFIWGFFVLAIVGFISIATTRGRRVQAFVYGIGLALSFDEFGMWIHLTDRYNIEASQDAMAWIFALLIFLVYGIGIARRAWPLMRKTLRR
jgi:hypothetical protein